MEKYDIINFDDNSPREIVNAIVDILNHFGVYTIKRDTNHGTQIEGIITNVPDAFVQIIDMKIKQIKYAIESEEVQDNNNVEFYYYDMRIDTNAYITIIIRH